jgi:hypothetical protein
MRIGILDEQGLTLIVIIHQHQILDSHQAIFTDGKENQA